MIGTMELPTLALKLGSQHKIISIGKCMVSEKPHFKKFQSKGPIHKPLILWITENYTTYITLTEVAGEGGPAVSQKLSKIKKFFKIFFASHEAPKLLGQ